MSVSRGPLGDQYDCNDQEETEQTLNHQPPNVVEVQHNSFLFRVLILLCAPLFAISGCSSDSNYRGISKLPDINAGAVTLTEVRSDGSSRPFQLKAETGELLVLFFGFTNCPDICPTTLSDIRLARQELGNKARRVKVAFVTVDRERDTPHQLTSYLARFDMQDDHALRPVDDQELLKATKTVFASSGIDNGNVNHTSWTYVINDQGKVVLEWDYGTPSKDMTHDMKLLLAK